MNVKGLSGAETKSNPLHKKNPDVGSKTVLYGPVIYVEQDDAVTFKDNEEVQCHAISTLRNLAASSEKNKGEIVKAGAVDSIQDLVLDAPINVQSEMTACVAVLALSGTNCNTSGYFRAHSNVYNFLDELKSQLLDMGICKVLIPLTKSPSIEVQGNSAAALGNLSSKGMCYTIISVYTFTYT